MICKSLNRAEDQNIMPSSIRNFENVFNSGCEYNQRSISRTPSSSSGLPHSGKSDCSSPPSLSSPSAKSVYKRSDDQECDKNNNQNEQVSGVLLVNGLMDCGGKNP